MADILQDEGANFPAVVSMTTELTDRRQGMAMQPDYKAFHNRSPGEAH
jgi:hypothetical protein